LLEETAEAASHSAHASHPTGAATAPTPAQHIPEQPAEVTHASRAGALSAALAAGQHREDYRQERHQCAPAKSPHAAAARLRLLTPHRLTEAALLAALPTALREPAEKFVEKTHVTSSV
jgi:hypothetical protein